MEASSKESPLALANWPWPLYCGFVLLIFGAVAYVEWKNHRLDRLWMWVPMILIGGWVLRQQSRADLMNKRSRCARCGCTLAGQPVMTFGSRGGVHSYCLRCSSIVKWARYLVHGTWLLLATAMLSFVAYQAGWIPFVLTAIGCVTIGGALVYSLAHGRPGIMASPLMESETDSRREVGA